jgi:hypothetical protein
MTRLILLFLVVALAVPGAASAMPDRDLRATPAQPTQQHLTAPDRDAGTRAALDAHGVDQPAANRKARAIEKYYASYGTMKPVEIAAASTEPVSSGRSGPSWFGTLGIGFGLILIAGGLGVYAGRSLRPRHLGT